MKPRPIVSACDFPNWHVDPRSEAIHGKGWNEWTEGAYVEPDTATGCGRLEAIRSVFR